MIKLKLEEKQELIDEKIKAEDYCDMVQNQEQKWGNA